MRRDKTFARILLIFSIANVVLAAPVVVRQRRFVTDRSDGDVGEAKDGVLLYPYEVIDNHFANQPPGSSGSVAQGPPPSMDGSLHQDSAPVSVAPQSNEPAPVSENLPSQHDPPLASEVQPLLDHPPPASEATQLHPLPGSRAQSSPDDMHPSLDDWSPLWDNLHPVPEIEMVGEPNVHDVPDVHNDQDDLHNTDDINKLSDKWEWLSDLARFHWGVRFYTLPSLSCRYLYHVTNVLTYDSL
jgi:hypothetical protein